MRDRRMDQKTKMEIVAINVAPMRGNKILSGATVFLFLHGRDLEHYVELCHLATCDDICLMERISVWFG